MKFIVCILAFLALGSCSVHNAFGITKSSTVILAEFAEAVNKVLGSIGYIQFYDISEKIKVFPVDPEVTLSKIEMSSLKIVNGLEASGLTYTTGDASVTIKGEDLTLSMEADLTLGWTYKVGGTMVYKGTYLAKLKTTSSKLDFSMILNQDKSRGSIGLVWTIAESSVKGFGGYSLVKKTIDDMVIKKLYPQFGEELNRYNDIIVSSLVYNYYYRSIPIPLPEGFKDKVSIKNVLSKFMVGPNSDYLTFSYSSSVYFAIKHLSIPLKGTFEPKENYENQISIYLGYKQMAEVAETLWSDIYPKEISYDPTELRKIFGYDIRVRTLATFHTRLVEQFNPEAHVNFKCILLEGLGTKRERSYRCQFLLHSDQRVVLFDIPKLVWESDFVIEPEKKKVTLKLGPSIFSDIDIKQPLIPIYVAKQLMNFIQPIAKQSKGSSINIPIVGDNINWEYQSHDSNANGDITIFLSKE